MGGPTSTSLRLRIDLAYDGTPFRGFARQPDQDTVQGRLETALQTVFRQTIVTTGAGRTDRGVHARGQVVHADLDPSPATRGAANRLEELLADPGRARWLLDRAVGDHITIWNVLRVPTTFDARHSATRRHYRYRLLDSPAVDPITSRDAWQVPGPLHLRPMQQGAKHLIGLHDFASVCRNKERKTTLRRITATSVTRPAPGEILVRVSGVAFCHQQVRSIVGCLVAIGRGEREPGWMAEVLEARDRAAAAAVAPPQGLVLESVGYGRNFPASPLLSR